VTALHLPSRSWHLATSSLLIHAGGRKTFIPEHCAAQAALAQEIIVHLYGKEGKAIFLEVRDGLAAGTACHLRLRFSKKPLPELDSFPPPCSSEEVTPAAPSNIQRRMEATLFAGTHHAVRWSVTVNLYSTDLTIHRGCSPSPHYSFQGRFPIPPQVTPALILEGWRGTWCITRSQPLQPSSTT
jgi:hypothetical protein